MRNPKIDFTIEQMKGESDMKHLESSLYLNDTQIETYKRLSALASAITDAISEFDVAVLNSDIPQEVKVRCLDVTYAMETDGLAYRLHPQSEWQGGDSFKTRAPHIAHEAINARS